MKPVLPVTFSSQLNNRKPHFAQLNTITRHEYSSVFPRFSLCPPSPQPNSIIMFRCFSNRQRFHLMERSKKKDHNNKKTKKPSSTRLQKHAPPSLTVVTKAEPNIEIDENGSSATNAIPLLSPLFLSPVAVAEMENNNNKGKEFLAMSGGNVAVSEGWKFAADVVAVEPSSKMDALYQSQCMLVNNI